MFDEIIEQLRSYCDCIGDLDTDNPDKRSKVEKNLTELIRLVSVSTCWATGKVPKFKEGCCCHDTFCDSFLLSTREEVLEPQDISDLCGSCDGGLMKINLYYNQVIADSITIDIVYRDGIRFENVPFGEFTYDPYGEILWLDMSEYLPSGTCSCRELYKIIIRYDAGFERLPECLLPVFCELLKYVDDMNRCDCEACPVCEIREDSEEPDNRNQKDIWYWVRKQLYETWIRQLEMIALCDYPKYWGNVL